MIESKQVEKIIKGDGRLGESVSGKVRADNGGQGRGKNKMGTNNKLEGKWPRTGKEK